MVFDRPDVWDLTVSFWDVLLPIAVAMTVMGALIAYSLGRSFLSRQTAGVDEMVGLIGRCESDLDPKGKVFVRGEYWNAVLQDTDSADAVSKEGASLGDTVEVVAVEGLTLRVRQAQKSS